LPRFEVVLFDLDGTLVDSSALILESFHGTTEAVLGRRFPDDEILALVGGGSPAKQMAVLEPAHVEALVREYDARIGTAYDAVECFAGVAGVLEELKRAEIVERAFTGAGIADCFDVVVGSDATERHKPDPEPILHALSLLGATPAQAAYVGDSPFDASAAKAAGVFAVAVGWGGIHRVEDADVFVETPEELLDVLG